ncbi:MAG: HAMP domain-containing sensor histidine kinase, partial [Sulfobacillus sp.]|nr:HAMP domain-containing sensor histidine kinase [Sulfobacillus sp.]
QGDHYALTVSVEPLCDVSGNVTAYLVWTPAPLENWLANGLETGIIFAYQGQVVWANRAAQEQLGVTVGTVWDSVAEFPPWRQLTRPENPATFRVRRIRHHVVRFSVIGPYVLTEITGSGAPQDSISSDYLAGMVHEIRNPLAALSGYVEMAQMATDEERSTYLSPMMHEIERLTRLTDDLLFVFRPLRVHPRPVRLDEIVEQAWYSVGRGQRGALTVRLEKRYDVTQMLYADPDRLQQILLNLMKNALDAMTEGRGTTIRIMYRQESGYVRLTVEDDGPGIPPEVQAQLFVKRVTTKASGTGLGLFVVQRLVEAHGGFLEVISGKQGTVAHIWIPEAPDITDSPTTAANG